MAKNLTQILDEFRSLVSELELCVSENETIVEETSTPARVPGTRGRKPLSEKTPQPSTPAADFDSDDIPSKEELDGMPFNDIRALGAKLGVKAGGKRDEIIANILSISKEIDKSGPDKKDTTVSTEKTSGKKPLGKKQSEPEPEPEPESEDDETPDEDQEIMTTLEEMSDEDLKQLLKESGLKALGKRQALIDRVFAAVKDGTIAFEDDGEDDEEAEPEAADEQVWDLYGEIPELAVNCPDCEMTDERRAKLEELDKVYFDEGTGESEKEIDKALTAYFGKRIKLKDYDFDKKEKIYVEVLKMFIDDDGIENEEGNAYELNGEYYCCGVKLGESNHCDVCGTDYE